MRGKGHHHFLWPGLFTYDSFQNWPLPVGLPPSLFKGWHSALYLCMFRQWCGCQCLHVVACDCTQVLYEHCNHENLQWRLTLGENLLKIATPESWTCLSGAQNWKLNQLSTSLTQYSSFNTLLLSFTTSCYSTIIHVHNSWQCSFMAQAILCWVQISYCPTKTAVSKLSVSVSHKTTLFHSICKLCLTSCSFVNFAPPPFNIFCLIFLSRACVVQCSCTQYDSIRGVYCIFMGFPSCRGFKYPDGDIFGEGGGGGNGCHHDQEFKPCLHLKPACSITWRCWLFHFPQTFDSSGGLSWRKPDGNLGNSGLSRQVCL